ncbi:MAG: FKBP-type peptidyl-prolyl cis-trans isomerase [Nevskiaceae bacterium]|nr:MAG: FKBP-type peptidyl-prolyl cis-trans isomerase [Nevskiaceae bacterium]
MLTTKRTLLAVAVAGLALAACQKNEGNSVPNITKAEELTTDAQKFGYAIGVDLAKSLQPVKDDVDIKALEAGLDTVFSGGTSVLDDKTREEIKNTVAQKLQKKQLEERTAAAGKAKEEGEKFLAENAKKSGVKTTASGLQYEVLTEGKGDAPKATDTVTVHYKGTLINGETFDSSYDRGQPVSFPLQNVIPGWTEGLQLMKPGAKYKFVIPSNLAYGERGAGIKIGPNATLVFEVELLSIGEPKK